MKASIQILLSFLILTTSSAVVLAADTSDTRWKGQTPEELKDSQPWQDLTTHFLDNGMYFSAMAAASRMLVFFTDLPSKEFAYKTVINLIDKGYPYSTQNLFLGGDIEPHDEYDFVNSYNLYKAILNKEKGLEKWAQNYFSALDKDNFPKYSFFLALQSYNKGDLKKTEEDLKKILSKDLPEDQLPFVRKVARTLARVYFDEKQYDKSLDVYQSFLLKLNPVWASDWVEAAWDLYHLNRYPEALGYLYNLESRKTDDGLTLEKYTIRALIYRDTCAVSNAENLAKTFRADFGPVIDGIKRGEPLTRFPILRKIPIAGNAPYRQITHTYMELQRERSKLTGLSKVQRAVANYLYESETRMLRQQLKSVEETALDLAADRVVTMGEQIRFLKFGGIRETYNPDVVFRPEETPEVKSDKTADFTHSLRWLQFGDYWRDERLNFKGDLTSRCNQ